MSKSSTKTVEENIEHDKFVFFKTLNTDETINNEFQTNITIELHTLESQNLQLDTTNSELNKEINTHEIMKAIKSLKNGKSAPVDDITNEMLKHGTPVFINAIK